MRRAALVSLVFIQTAACGGPQYARIGPPVPLDAGPPRTSCETREWYALAPARVQATGATAGFGFNTYYSQVHEGVAVFRDGSSKPEDLEDLLPKMGEPELARQHQARIDPVDAASRRSIYWSVGGLIGLFGGVGVAAAIQDQSHTAANVFGISGIVLGVVGLVGALVSQPSGEEQLYADTRRKLFIPGEDDLSAATRGVDKLDDQRRRQCVDEH